MIKNNKGLTLVNLIATLVLMLIITYITVSLVVGDEGVINEADTIRNQSEIEDIKEKIHLSVIKNTAENGDIDIDAIKSEVENGDIKNITLENSEIKFKYNGVEYTVDVNDVSDTVKAGYNDSSTPNAPYLMSGMEPVKWVVNEEGVEEPVKTNENDKDWYNYDKQLWANAKTVEDGSYWVWIPRYEYKITYYTDDTKETVSETKTLYGTIDINFISKEKTIPTPGYKIHPAFTDGTDNYFDNGEWDKEVSGIWVSKYSMSCEVLNADEEWVNKTLTYSNDDIVLLTTNAGGTNGIRAVSKPDNIPWNNVSIGGAFRNSYNYDREKQSHLMKNSEFGALMYLSYSIYGTNCRPVNEYNLSYNYNETGVYSDTDIYVSAYLADGLEFTTNSGSSESLFPYLEDFYLEDKYEENDTKSTKYVTRYPCDLINNGNITDNREASILNFKEYQSYSETRYGDAVLEIFSVNEEEKDIKGFSDSVCEYPFKYKDSGNAKVFWRGSNTLSDEWGFSFEAFWGNACSPACFKVVLIGE